ncbi:MAG: hypothetical protein ACI96M_000802 [Candidatus Azotimanducaceae bacterium]|jgi:hypothetical protein
MRPVPIANSNTLSVPASSAMSATHWSVVPGLCALHRNFRR